MDNKGLLIVLSGPSGAGKGTVLKNALEKNHNLRCSISVTTRAPRPGEIDGVNYFFKSKDEFVRMIANNEFLEFQEVYGNYYGTPLPYVNKMRDEGTDVILEIDVKGALSVRDRVDDAVMIFLTPKDKATLASRLIGRATESKEALDTRLAAAEEEIAQSCEYEYLVINEHIDKCADDILTIIQAEKLRVMRNGSFVKQFAINR